ncbi:MAG: DUF6580 family putative transport protein [Terriglobales bacterium]
MSYLLLLAAMAAGVLPHLPNFSPVFGAMLLGGASLRRRDTLWLPLALWAALCAVEALAVYHSHLGWGLIWTVAAMAPMAGAGELLRRKRSLLRVGLASTLGATGFFVFSNFGVWVGGAMYPPTLAGLGACYLAAVPFYGNSVLAAILFGGVLLAAEGWLMSRRLAGAEVEP